VPNTDEDIMNLSSSTLKKRRFLHRC